MKPLSELGWSERADSLVCCMTHHLRTWVKQLFFHRVTGLRWLLGSLRAGVTWILIGNSLTCEISAEVAGK